MFKNHNMEPSNNTETSNDVTVHGCATWPWHRMHDANGNSAFCCNGDGDTKIHSVDFHYSTHKNSKHHSSRYTYWHDLSLHSYAECTWDSLTEGLDYLSKCMSDSPSFMLG